MIVDQFGRPYEVKKRPGKEDLAPAAVYLSQRDYVTAGLTPQGLAAIFREADSGEMRRQAELFEALEEKDAHIIGDMGKRRNVMSEINFLIEPASDSAEDARIAEFVQETLGGIPDWDDVPATLQDAIGKGYSSLEIVWDTSSGQAVPQALEFLPQSRFRFNGMDGYVRTVPLLISDANPFGDEIPAWSTIFHRYGGKTGNGTRSGIYRVCAWMYLFKNYSIKDWVVFCEVYGMPLRIGKFEPGAGKDDKAALITAIRSIGTDAAGIISKSTEIEFVESVKASAGGELYENLISFANREMSKAIVGQAQSSDSKSPGSFASDKVKDMVRKDLIKSDARALANAVRSQLIRPIVGFNFGWDKPLPKYGPDMEEQEDLQAKSIMVARLVDRGVRIPEQWVYREFGIPEPGEKDTIVTPPERPGMPVAAKLGLSRYGRAFRTAKAQFGADKAKFITGKIAERLSDELDPVMSEIIDRLKKLVEESASLQEVRERMDDVFPEAAPEDIVELMQQAFIIAELQGRHDVVEG